MPLAMFALCCGKAEASSGEGRVITRKAPIRAKPKSDRAETDFFQDRRTITSPWPGGTSRDNSLLLAGFAHGLIKIDGAILDGDIAHDAEDALVGC